MKQLIHIRISKETKDYLNQVALEDSRSLSNLVKFILDEYVSEHKTVYGDRPSTVAE